MENIPDASEKYIEALMDGRTAFLTNLARQQGKKLDEYKFFWAEGGLEIFVDDMKFLLVVKLWGKIVCSNELMIFVPGNWWEIVAPFKGKTEQIIKHLKMEEVRRALEVLIENSEN